MATLTGTTIDKNTWVTLLDVGQPLVVPPDTTWLFNAWVVGRGESEEAGFTVAGVIGRDGLSAPDLIGEKKSTVGRTKNSMKADAIEDLLNDALAIRVKGVKDKAVNWVARVEVTPIPG